MQLNRILHESKIYNGVQLTLGALGAFGSGMVKGIKYDIQNGIAKCFIAGTLISTANGLVAIENIKSGDKVLSTNEITKETEIKTVVETYVRETMKLIHIRVSGEEIVTTEGHPFYVKDIGFVNACDLIVGEELVDILGKVLLVEDIRVEYTPEPVKVYNFQVEDYHTYYVGNCAVWVHNANYKEANIQNFTIKDKHLNGSKAKRARKFNVSTPEEANLIVQDAMKNGKLYSVTENGMGLQGQNSYFAIIDAGKIIGTKGETFIKLVFDDFNNVWTTYPIPNP